MPTYEFRCRACGSTFTQQRPMAASGDPATCPDGHTDTVRMLTMAGTITGATPTRASTAGSARPAAGGCCGGGCCA